MDIDQLMSKDLRTCAPEETLDCAARIMWENDCGIVPIVDDAGRLAGMITDRDICIAAYTQNRTLKEMTIANVAMKPVVTVRSDDSPRVAEQLMRQHQLRRLAVVDRKERLVGMLSLNDLARRAGDDSRGVPVESVAKTLAAISSPVQRPTPLLPCSRRLIARVDP